MIVCKHERQPVKGNMVKVRVGVVAAVIAVAVGPIVVIIIQQD
jgi:hypothetical protein